MIKLKSCAFEFGGKIHNPTGVGKERVTAKSNFAVDFLSGLVSDRHRIFSFSESVY